VTRVSGNSHVDDVANNSVCVGVHYFVTAATNGVGNGGAAAVLRTYLGWFNFYLTSIQYILHVIKYTSFNTNFTKCFNSYISDKKTYKYHTRLSLLHVNDHQIKQKLKINCPPNYGLRQKWS